MSAEEKCLSEYRKVLINPFDEPPSCVPWVPALPSRKMKNWAKGSLTASTSRGFAFVTVAPHLAHNSSVQPIVWSTGSYANSVIETNPLVAGIDSARFNTPYTANDYNNNFINGRVVSMGVRVRYIGSELSRAGRLIALEEPNHQSLNGKNAASLLEYPRAKSVPVTRDWTATTWQPVSPSEFAFTDGSDYVNGGHYCLGIVIEGATPDTVFEFEAFINYEVIGSIVTGVTPSHSNVQGTGHVLAEVGQMPTTFFDSVSNGFMNGVGHVGRYLGTQAAYAMGANVIGRLPGRQQQRLSYY